jgi:hypothetical protein
MFFSRGKNKVKDPYTVKDIYSFYITDIGLNSLYYVEQKEYCDIIYDFYKTIIERILYENALFKMPYGIGDLSVGKTKVKLDRLNILSVDWINTVDNGKYIYHLNEHSKGFKYFFHWSKKRKKIKNQYYYKLVMTRANKRLLAKLIKSGKYDYFEK